MRQHNLQSSKNDASAQLTKNKVIFLILHLLCQCFKTRIAPLYSILWPFCFTTQSFSKFFTFRTSLFKGEKFSQCFALVVLAMTTFPLKSHNRMHSIKLFFNRFACCFQLVGKNKIQQLSRSDWFGNVWRTLTTVLIFSVHKNVCLEHASATKVGLTIMTRRVIVTISENVSANGAVVMIDTHKETLFFQGKSEELH